MSAAAILEVLLDHWDPIGLAHCPEARREYEAYVPAIRARLVAGAPAAELAGLLQRLRTGPMGLGEQPVEELLRVAERLRAAAGAPGAGGGR